MSVQYLIPVQKRSNVPLILVGVVGVGLLVAGGVLLYRNRKAAAAAAMTPAAAPEPATNGTTEAPQKKEEVFHIGCGTDYAYGVKREKAEAICNAMQAELATKEQLDAAIKDGASWCSCGWVKDDAKNAYYPGTGQKDCGSKQQLETCKDRDTYCVNCYGVKPKRDGETTLKADISLGRRGDMTVLPFNIANNWSEWEERDAEEEGVSKATAAQRKPITLHGWAYAV